MIMAVPWKRHFTKFAEGEQSKRFPAISLINLKIVTTTVSNQFW